jgi:hypothetical protein
MDLLAQPAFRADPVAVADDQHTHQQLGIDRRPARRAVKRRQVRPHLAQLDEAVDGPEHMARWHVLFEAELVEQRALHDLPIAHHRFTPPSIGGVNQRRSAAATSEFFNRICHKRTFRRGA